MMVTLAQRAMVLAMIFPAVAARINYPATLAELHNKRQLQEISATNIALPNNCHTCDCFTCYDVETLDDGTLSVTFDHCKDDTISWMCCVGVDGQEGNCDLAPGSCTGTQQGAKCNSVEPESFKVIVPATSKTITINTHDGKTQGDANAVNSVCGGRGNQGGSCATDDYTAHCLITFDLVTDCGYNPGPTAPTPAAPTPGAPTPAAPTPGAPTPRAPTPAAPTPGGAGGDPHVKTWAGEQFDFHGGCDLVLVSSKKFLNGVGMDVHIRTKVRTWWSYIDSAVVRIGDETFEVQGGKNEAHYWINGVPGANLTASQVLDSTVAGFSIEYRVVSEKLKVFRFVDIAPGVGITLETFNEFVRVTIRSEVSDHFEGAVGLMGSYPTGAKMARDGMTIMSDTDAFGQEWQVRVNEPKLFRSVEGPQFPESCQMPSSEERRVRRLQQGALTLSDAQVACARVSPEDRDACIFDVLATNDKDMAGSY